jgi:hypothetical protein
LWEVLKLISTLHKTKFNNGRQNETCIPSFATSILDALPMHFFLSPTVDANHQPQKVFGGVLPLLHAAPTTDGHTKRGGSTMDAQARRSPSPPRPPSSRQVGERGSAVKPKLTRVIVLPRAAHKLSTSPCLPCRPPLPLPPPRAPDSASSPARHSDSCSCPHCSQGVGHGRPRDGEVARRRHRLVSSCLDSSAPVFISDRLCLF